MNGIGQIIRHGELTPGPWPNGRGVTRDIVHRTGPDGQPEWFLSLADLTADAPFSDLPGLDRVFTLVEGGPVDLTVQGAGTVACSLLVPVHFPGDRPTESRVGGGLSRAFNVFVDRSTLAARISVISVVGAHSILGEIGLVALFCVSGEVEIDGIVLGAGDTFLPDEAIAGFSAPNGPATVLSVSLTRRGPAT